MRHRNNRRHNSYFPNLHELLRKDIHTQTPKVQAASVIWLVKSATGFEKTSRIIRNSSKRFYENWTFKEG